MGAPSFPRSAMSCGDKRDEEIKASVTGHLREHLTALAVIDGMTLSEYVFRVLSDHVYGRVDTIRMLARHGLHGQRGEQGE